MKYLVKFLYKVLKNLYYLWLSLYFTVYDFKFKWYNDETFQEELEKGELTFFIPTFIFVILLIFGIHILATTLC